MSNIVSIPVAGDKLDDIFVNHTTEFYTIQGNIQI